MADVALAVGIYLLVAVVLWGVLRLSGGVERWLESSRNPDLAGIEARVGRLEAKVDELPSIWEQYADRANRAAERQRHYARQAAKRDEEGELATELYGGDAGGGDRSGLPAVREAVEDRQPDYVELTNRRKFGLG